MRPTLIPAAALAAAAAAATATAFVVPPVLAPHRPPRRRAVAARAVQPLPSSAYEALLPRTATADQVAYYWRDSERSATLLNVVMTTVLGLWGCYFVQFVVGPSLATLGGAGFLSYPLVAPHLDAWRRRDRLLARSSEGGGGGGASNVGLFSGTVEAVRRGGGGAVEVTAVDAEGRALVVRTPARSLASVRDKRNNGRVEAGMPCEAVVFGQPHDPEFRTLVGASDVYVPAADAWVGTYPQVARLPLKSLLRRRQAAGAGPRRRQRREPPPPEPEAAGGGLEWEYEEDDAGERGGEW